MRTPAVEPGNMNEDQLNQYKNYIASTPTFHELMYLGYWRENLTKKSKDAFHSERALADYVETEQTQVQEVNAVPLQRNVYTGGKLGKEISNNRKKLCKKRFQEKYASNDPDVKRNQEINEQATDVYERGLLPYFGRVVDFLILHALNTSVAQGKIRLREAQQKYKEATEHTKFLYNLAYVKEYNKYTKTCSKMGRNYHVRHMAYNPVNMLEQLRNLGLGPIQDRYTKLHTLVEAISYDVDDQLKTEVLDILDMFYNILCSNAIVRIMADIVIIQLVHNAPKNNELTRVITDKTAPADFYIAKYRVYLANFILDSNSDLNFTNIDAIVTGLENLGLSTSAINLYL